VRTAGIEAPTARYRQVANDLREAIARGQFSPGDALPSQPELAGIYRLNQTSISRAIAILAAEGLVRTEHGRGTYVQDIPAAKHTRRIPPPASGSSFADEMRNAGIEPRTELVQAETADPPAAVAQRLHLRAAEQVLISKWLIFADARPIQVSASYIPLSIARSADLALPDTEPTAIHQQLAKNGYHVSRFVEEVECRRPTVDEAALLRISEGQPVLDVVRLALDQAGRTLEMTINVFPGQMWLLRYEWPADG